MTMGALRNGSGGASADRPPRRGLGILQHLSGGVESLAPASGSSCPPRLRQIVQSAVQEAAENDHTPAFSALPVDAMGNDPACRQLARALQAAADRAGKDLCAGRPAAELQREIRNRVMDNVMGVVVGAAVKDERPDLLGGGHRHEQEIFFGVVGALAAEHLAAGLVRRGASAPGAGGAGLPPLNTCGATALIRDALLSAAPAAPLAVKIARSIYDATADRADEPGAEGGSDPTIAITGAVARAVARACAPAAPRGPRPAGGPERRERGGRLTSGCICREIARELAGPVQ